MAQVAHKTIYELFMKIPGDAVNHPLECSESNYKSANKSKKRIYFWYHGKLIFSNQNHEHQKKEKQKKKNNDNHKKNKKTKKTITASHKDLNNNLSILSKIQLVVYYQCCTLIG